MSHRESRERRTLYCGNLHENVTEEILFELFLQVIKHRFSQSFLFRMIRVVHLKRLH